MSEPISVLFLGGCLIHGPISNLIKAGGSGLKSAPLSRGGTPPTYSFGEIFQAIRLFRNEIEMSPEIRSLCSVRQDFQALPGAGTFAKADVAIVEPISPINIRYQDYTLNRAALFRHVTNPLKTDRNSYNLASRWFKKGLWAMDEEERRQAGEKLAALVPDDMPMAAVARDVFLNAYGEKVDVDFSLREIARQIARPLGIMTYTFQYMPDGRPLSWPTEFRDEVVEAARKLDLPVFEPWHLVRDYGAANVLLPDNRHYQDHFIPVMAKAIRDFAFDIRDRASTEKPLLAAS